MPDETFTPHGKHLIAGEWVAGAATFDSEPAHGPSHAFAVATTPRCPIASRCRART